MLRGLIAACEQDDQVCATLRVVNPVTRASIDTKLRDSVRQVAMIAGITVNKTVDSDLNSRTAGPIAKTVDPVQVNLG